jgi:cell shape-determining protein MreC
VEDFAGFAPDTSGIIAGILSRPPLSPYDTLVVAAGTNAGVAPGMRVFAPGGVPIGTVISTLSSSATVTLYSSPGTTLSAWVGDDRVPVTLTGEGGGAFSATAPKSAGILEGDIVYVVGTITAPLGVIKDITTNASSPSVELFVAPSVNLFSLVWVTVVP